MNKKLKWGWKFVMWILCFFLIQTGNAQELPAKEEWNIVQDGKISEMPVSEEQNEVQDGKISEMPMSEERNVAKDRSAGEFEKEPEDPQSIPQFTVFYHEYARKEKTCSANHIGESIASIDREQMNSDSEIYIERGTKVTVRLETESFEERYARICLQQLDFSDGQEKDITVEYLKKASWVTGQDGSWYLSVLFVEEGHYRLKASYGEANYVGPIVTVDEKEPVIAAVETSSKPIKQMDGYDFYEGYPVYEIIVEEENFHRDCFHWKCNAEGIRMSDWTSYYDDGIRKNRICFVAEKDRRYDLVWEIKDAGGRHRVQEECHFVVDSTAPNLTLSVVDDDSVFRYSYKDLSFCSKSPIPVCLRAEDAESGIAGIRYTYQDTEGNVAEGYLENPHFTSTFSVTVDKMAKIPDFCGWIRANAINGMGLECSSRPIQQELFWESENNHEKNASVDILYPNSSYTDSRKKIRYYKEVPEITIIGRDRLSGICKSYVQATLGKEIQKQEEDYRFHETVQKEIAQKIRLSFEKMNRSCEHQRISIQAGILDHAGYEKKVKGEYDLVVDSLAPEVRVVYDVENDTSFYNKGRTAIVTVKDWNFNSKAVRWKINGQENGYTIGSWQKKGQETSCKITFSKDGTYQLGIEVSDYAGNRVNHQEDPFTVDQKAPVMRLWMDRKGEKHGKYYASEQMVYVLLQEDHIRKDKIAIYNGNRDDREHLIEIKKDLDFPKEIKKNIQRGGWKVYAIRYRRDAVYHIHGWCQDQAGNQAECTGTLDFVIDQTPPKLQLEHLRRNIIYTEKDFNPEILLSDRNLDSKACNIHVLYRDGSRAAFMEERMNRSEGNHSILFTWDNLPKKQENDNGYLFEIQAQDLAGNEVVLQRRIPFYVDRYGARFLLEADTEAYLNRYYHKEEQDICLRVYSLFPLDTDIMVLKDKEKSIFLDEKDYKMECRRLGFDSFISEEKIPEILPIKYYGWYENRYRISKELFAEEGDYQISVHSKEIPSGKSMDTITVKDSENILWTRPIQYAIDKTPPDIIIGGLEEEIYDVAHRTYTVTATDNHRLQRVRLHVKKDGKEYMMEYPEDNFNEFHSIKGELTSSNGYQFIGYEAWDYAGNYCSNLRTSEEKKVLVTENPVVLIVSRHPISRFIILAVAFCLFAALIILTRYGFFGIFKRQEN